MAVFFLIYIYNYRVRECDEKKKECDWLHTDLVYLKTNELSMKICELVRYAFSLSKVGYCMHSRPIGVAVDTMVQ